MIKDAFNRRIIMAPMSGTNTPAFCTLLREFGCDFIYTGLLTSHGLVHQNRKTKEILRTLPGGVTLAGQIFGSNPDVMAEAARILEATGRVHMIDINMGCPVPKVVKTSAGCGLMREPELAGEIVRAVAAAIELPVTVKMRAGWDSGSINCIELARRCVGEGAAAVALHPRTRTQGFSGKADWSLVARMKDSIEAPVIASGDVDGPRRAADCFDATGCDSIMIGRAAMGDPGLVGRVRRYVEVGVEESPPDFLARLRTARRHLELHAEYVGEKVAVREMRGPMARYVKGIPGSSAFRAAVNSTDTMAGVLELLDEFEEQAGSGN